MLLCVHVWGPSIEVQALQSMLCSQVTLGVQIITLQEPNNTQ